MQLRVEELDRQKSILEKEVKRLYGGLLRAKIGVSRPFSIQNLGLRSLLIGLYVEVCFTSLRRTSITSAR